MNNKPVAWIKQGRLGYPVLEFDKPFRYESYAIQNPPIPLYTQDQLEEARKLGMQQEQALWELAASSQEIMDTHPVKEQDESFDRTASHMAGEYVSWTSCVACGQKVTGDSIHTCSPQLKQLTDEEIKSCWNWETDCQEWAIEFARAILRKAQEK